MDSLLPDSLMRCFADSEVEVLSWSATSGSLLLRLRKDIGPEVGIVMFVGVSCVNLPPRMTVAGLTCERHPVPEFPELDSGDAVFRFSDAEGRSFFVVAESIQYAVEV
jgi:hypothetical protein